MIRAIFLFTSLYYGLFVLFTASSFRFLATPAYRFQDSPNLWGIVANSKLLTDYRCDAFQCPQVCFVTVIYWAFFQQTNQILALFVREFGRPTGRRFAFKSFLPALFVGIPPSYYRTAGGANYCSNLADSTTIVQQSDCSPPTPLKLLCCTFWPHT